MTNTLSVQNLRCERGEQILFDQLNFEAHSGDVIQIQGLNGSGKTSLLRMLAGLGLVSTGSIVWNMQSIHEIKEQYGKNLVYVGHKLGLKDDLNAIENLSFYQKTYKLPSKLSIEKALDELGLTEKKVLPIRDLSAGQKRKVALSKLLFIPANLWILDEPFTAIDKDGVSYIINLMEQHSEKGGIVIYTSHQDVSMSVNKKSIRL